MIYYDPAVISCDGNTDTPPSHKAWMSTTDADMLEQVVLFMAARQTNTLNVLEWGCGKSTAYFTELLYQKGFKFQWHSIEHNRDYFCEFISTFKSSVQMDYLFYDNDKTTSTLPSNEHNTAKLHFSVFDLRAAKSPFIVDRPLHYPDGTSYVKLPRTFGIKFDIILIDGRYRRLCLCEAATLMNTRGITILHDAWRTFYHCAFENYEHHQRIGEELWIGSQSSLDFISIRGRPAGAKTV